MHRFYRIVLYTALALGANVSLAADAALEALRVGDMKKLNLHSTAKEVPEAVFFTEDGGEMTLAAYKGKVLLVNFWATWCAPCRAEMPMLSALQEEFGGEDFQVLTISTGRDNPAKIARFFDEIGVTNLPQHRDVGMKMARRMAVLGLPVVLLMDRDGQEIARLTGPAKWDAPEAKALIASLLAQD